MSKIVILVKNRNSDQKEKFCSKIRILVKHRKVWSKIEILVKIEILLKNRNSYPKFGFWSKTKFFICIFGWYFVRNFYLIILTQIITPKYFLDQNVSVSWHNSLSFNFRCGGQNMTCVRISLIFFHDLQIKNYKNFNPKISEDPEYPLCSDPNSSCRNKCRGYECICNHGYKPDENGDCIPFCDENQCQAQGRV